MAVKVQRTLVCDFGERHQGEVRTYRITVDGSTTALDLCPRCAKPITRIVEQSGKPPTEQVKMRVYSMEEVQRRKKTPATQAG